MRRGKTASKMEIMTSPLSSRRRSKTPPPGETGQEALYLRSLSDRQVVVQIKLRDGETVRGWIEYFDDAMLRLTREGQPNLFIYKHQIRTISEAGSGAPLPPRSGAGKPQPAAAHERSIVSGARGRNRAVSFLGSQGSGDCARGGCAFARVSCDRASRPNTRATWIW